MKISLIRSEAEAHTRESHQLIYCGICHRHENKLKIICKHMSKEQVIILGYDDEGHLHHTFRAAAESGAEG